MYRTPLCALVLTSLAVAIVWQSSTGRGDNAVSSGTLPGARPFIEAIHFPTLQAAIDALPAEGGVLRLPPGKFEISQPLLLETPDVLIEGAGPTTHIINTNTAGKPALVIRPKDLASNPKGSLWRVQLANFRLTGNDKSGHGIEAIKVNEIFIAGLTVSYHGGDGIRLDRCYEDPRVCNSLITYNHGTGLELLANHDIVVAANHFEENLDGVRCLDGFNLCMTGNNIDDHLRHGVVIENSYGSVLSGNMIEECKGTGVILNRDAYGITLSANVIAHEQGGGIELRDAHGCTVSANSFPLVRQRALVIGPASGRITVTGNTFSNDYIGDGKRKLVKPEPSSGIVLEGAEDVTISGNTFSGLDTKALELTGASSRRVNFTGNVLVGVASDHDQLTDSHIADNVVTK
jgi:hypothetical protein